MNPRMKCARCQDTYWVCETHDWRLPNFFRLTREHGATLVAGYMERRGARKLLPRGWMVAE